MRKNDTTSKMVRKRWAVVKLYLHSHLNVRVELPLYWFRKFSDLLLCRSNLKTKVEPPVDWLREFHSPLLSFKLGIDFIAPRFGLAPEPSPYLLLFGLVLEDLKSILSPTPPVIMLLVGFCYYASGGFLLRSVFFNLRSVEICLLLSSACLCSGNFFSCLL